MAADYANRRRELRAARRAKGLCIHCERPAESGKTQCLQHLRSAANSMTVLHRARREASKCVRCGAYVAEGMATCATHGGYEEGRRAASRARKLEAAECLRCKIPAQSGSHFCGMHTLHDRLESQVADAKARDQRAVDSSLPGIRAILADRAPLEHERRKLLMQIEIIDAMLDEIGAASLPNAAMRYIVEHPGCMAREIRAATGITPEVLSRAILAGGIRVERGTGERLPGARGSTPGRYYATTDARPRVPAWTTRAERDK